MTIGSPVNEGMWVYPRGRSIPGSGFVVCPALRIALPVKLVRNLKDPADDKQQSLTLIRHFHPAFEPHPAFPRIGNRSALRRLERSDVGNWVQSFPAKPARGS